MSGTTRQSAFGAWSAWRWSERWGGCSVIFGKNVTAAAPGSAQALYLIVSDIAAARDELRGRGVESQQPIQDSDAHRIVGKVVRIHHDQKLVALATKEGMVTAEVSERMIRVIREGDTISVPRSAAESPAASPRQRR